MTPVRKSIHKNNLRCWLVTVSMNNKLTKNQSHNVRNYPSSDLLSLGVLHPVPEQQLMVQSPYGHYNTQLSWSSFTPEGNNHTLDTSPGLPSQPKGTAPWIPPASKSLRVLKKSL
ncbi:hypothetical protein Taro_011469 [Colocasia esculenta]|uniref:Uncharacterized protein n=1 Tax=Colocasia esculenta TaxID=4460 RepID=A0A843UA99_COLES|nr:hypothetical protein [Colocasia esculenta]